MNPKIRCPQLTPQEAERAARIGVRRRLHVMVNGGEDRNGLVDDGWGTNINGALAELACSRLLGIDWVASIDQFAQADVGGWEVRSSGYQYAKLIFRPEHDRLDRPYVLLIGKEGSFHVVGWMMGWEAQKLGEWIDPTKNTGGARKPAWFVHQERLRPWPADGTVPQPIPMPADAT